MAGLGILQTRARACGVALAEGGRIARWATARQRRRHIRELQTIDASQGGTPMMRQEVL